MNDLSHATSPVIFWRGFHHRWGYNHRANRLGSFVQPHSPGRDWGQVDVVHTAASGTGPDRVQFTEQFTHIKAAGVNFQAGQLEIKLVTVEDRLTDFDIRMNVDLDPAMADHSTFAVVLNGFDLYADGDADKLMTLALEMTDPQHAAGSSTLDFHIKGGFRVDCSSPECDLKVRRIREQYNHKWTDSVYLLDQKLLETPEVSGTKENVEGSEPITINRVVGPLSREVYYTLRVYYVIVGGDDDSLHVSSSTLIEHSYAWDRRREIHAQKQGARPLLGSEVIVGDTTQTYAASALGFKQVIVQMKRDTGGRSLLFWQKDKAMHLLELNVAVSNLLEVKPGVFTCSLDLFFKNWSKGMKKAHLWQSLFAFKDAGEAQFGVQLALLQFKAIDRYEPSSHEGYIDWPGGDKEAVNDPAARSVHTVDNH